MESLLFWIEHTDIATIEIVQQIHEGTERQYPQIHLPHQLSRSLLVFDKDAILGLFFGMFLLQSALTLFSREYFLTGKTSLPISDWKVFTLSSCLLSIFPNSVNVECQCDHKPDLWLKTAKKEDMACS